MSKHRETFIKAYGRLARHTLLAAAVLAATGGSACADAGPSDAPKAGPGKKPNIVFIIFEDMSERIGAFGDKVATTPVLDAFAETALRYPNTFTTAGVCAPSRSALITGVHQQVMGTQHMRTKGNASFKGGGPVEYEAVPPPEIKAFPELLRRAGYFTTNNGKTDYQFGTPFTVWDESNPDAHWRHRPRPDMPFYSMFTLFKTHEGYVWPEERPGGTELELAFAERNKRDLAEKKHITDPKDVVVPPYYPDTPVVRADLVRLYDNIAFQETAVADLMAQLREDGLLDNTIVIVTTDHGDGLPRMKRSVYDSGLKVPLMIRFPDGWRAGEVDEELISFVDLAPTILSWAGIDPPAWIQGRDFVGTDRDEPRQYIYASQDRMDFVPNRRKAVRDIRYKYIHNYRLQDPFFDHLLFRDSMPTMQELWRLHESGELPPAAEALFHPLPEDQLYDTSTDPYEVANLAGDPAHADVLERLKQALSDWVASAPDRSAVPEIEMIESMWPGLEQPVTAAPEANMVEGDDGMVSISLASDTEGASIGYTTDGPGPDAHWLVYNGSLRVPAGSTVRAKAIRYGYAESAEVTLKAD